MADRSPTLRTLLIDNYDSYTYNLFQLIAEVNGGELHAGTSCHTPGFLVDKVLHTRTAAIARAVLCSCSGCHLQRSNDMDRAC